MGVRPFTSESYTLGERPAAWRDVMNAIGLQPSTSLHLPGGFATASERSAPGIALMRLAAAPQSLEPLAWPSGEPPLALLLLEGAELRLAGGAISPIPVRRLVLLPRVKGYAIGFPQGLRAVVLSVGAEVAPRRLWPAHEDARPRICEPDGLAGLVANMMEATAETLDTLDEDSWSAAARALADLYSTHAQKSAASQASVRQTALTHRILQALERRLDDPELTPAMISASVGISERYLQKLMESDGSNFSQHLRERRLERARADLASPLETRASISEIAYRYGFNDSAHFSRVFRQRFGQSPREFRRGELEKATARARAVDRRGWPLHALSRARTQPGKLGAKAVDGAPVTAGEARGRRHHHLGVEASKVHWGYFSRLLKPVIEVASGDTITIETLTQHASDDPELMIHGDPGAESVFHWTANAKNVDRRGAGPMDASIFGRGAGEGFGVHICTGPVAVEGAEPGDVLEVRILDMHPRPSRNKSFAGRVFGSSVAAWWGYHYGELLAEAPPREVVTIYEILASDERPCARALYAYRWKPTTDPFGVAHAKYDYPGVPAAAPARRADGTLAGVSVPLRPHFGVIAVAPREFEYIDSVPPSYFGGNLDNWRLGKGATVYLPVSTPGALLSVGDPHAAQGDGELAGTAIECSMTGMFQLILHKKGDLEGRAFQDLTYPLIETPAEWVLTGFSHPNYLAEFGAQGQSEVYARSSLDLAMKDAFRKARRFLMQTQGLSEDEAIALMSAAVDFGVTQVVDGNWGVHAVIPKSLFEGRDNARGVVR